MKIYISGRITGLSFREYNHNFYSAQNFIKYSGHFKDFEPINPLEISPLFGIKKYWFYMFSDIKWLLKCDAIYLLKNWHYSRGSRLELSIAILIGKKIFLEK